jgi:hypothetical protein
MTEPGEKVPERPEDHDLRCPYCRGAVEEAADRDRVECGACAALQHAECAVEARGCAACRGVGFLVGTTGIDLPTLQTLTKDPARLARLARPRRWRLVARLLLHLGRLVSIAVGIAAGVATEQALVGLGAGVGWLLLVSAVSAFVFPPRRLRRVPADEWLAESGMLPHDPGRVLERQLETSGIPDPEFPPGPHPERCPACGTSLEAWFCHECGASAVPGDGKEKGDDGKEKEPPERERS